MTADIPLLSTCSDSNKLLTRYYPKCFRWHPASADPSGSCRFNFTLDTIYLNAGTVERIACIIDDNREECQESIMHDLFSSTNLDKIQYLAVRHLGYEDIFHSEDLLAFKSLRELTLVVPSVFGTTFHLGATRLVRVQLDEGQWQNANKYKMLMEVIQQGKEKNPDWVSPIVAFKSWV